MSASWTIKQMKKWYAMLSNDFHSSEVRGYYGTRRDLAEGLREAMMSKKPNESREYISSWFETISAYYDEQHKSSDNEIQEDRSDDNQMLMEVFRNYARAISRDKLRENEVIDAMREYFQITPVPVHPFAKEIEELRMFYRKQYEEGVSQKKSTARKGRR